MPIAENLLWQDLARANRAYPGQALGVPSPDNIPPLSEPIEERGEPAEIVHLMRAITQGTNIDPRPPVPALPQVAGQLSVPDAIQPQIGSMGTGIPQAPVQQPPGIVQPSTADVVRGMSAKMVAENAVKQEAARQAQHQAELAAFNEAKAQSQGMTQGMPTGPGGSYSTGPSQPVDAKAMLANKKISDNNFLRAPFNRGFIDDRGPLITALTDGTNLAPPRLNTIKPAGATYSKEELAALSPESRRAIEGRDKKISEDKAQIDRMQARNNDERREGSERLKWVGDSVLGHSTTEGKWQREMDSYRDMKLRDAEQHAQSGKGQQYRAQDERRMKAAGEDYVKVFTDGTNDRALQQAEAAKSQQQAGYGVQPQEWYDQRYGPIRGGEMRSQDLAHAAHANAEVQRERNVLSEGALNRGSHEKIAASEGQSRREVETLQQAGADRRAHETRQDERIRFKQVELQQLLNSADPNERIRIPVVRRELDTMMHEAGQQSAPGAAPSAASPPERQVVVAPVTPAGDDIVRSTLRNLSERRAEFKDPAAKARIRAQMSEQGLTPDRLREYALQHTGVMTIPEAFRGDTESAKERGQMSALISSILAGTPEGERLTREMMKPHAI